MWNNHSEKKKVQKPLWLTMLILSLICYSLILVCSLAFPFMLPIFVQNPIAAQLYAEYLSSAAALVLVIAPAVVMGFYYIYSSFVGSSIDRSALIKESQAFSEQDRQDQYNTQYEEYNLKQAVRRKSQIALSIFLAIQLVIIGRVFFFSDIPQERARLSEDITHFANNEFSVYEGPIHYSNYAEPKLFRYYSFSFKNTKFRCPKAILASTELLQGSYLVEYLPKTMTIVSITNMDGLVLTGTDREDLQQTDVPDGYWLYGDLTVRRCDEIYGYNQLSEAAQKAFDLMYGEYYSQGVLQGELPTQSFTLPESLTASETRQVFSLYKAATFHYNRPQFRYDTNDTGPVKKLYAGGMISVLYDANQFFEVQQKSAEIVAAMPDGLSQADQCYWLAEYLVKHVEYYGGYQDGKPKSDIGTLESGIEIRVSTENYQNPYGALFEGKANCLGYAKAYAALCHEAGIISIPVYGTVPTGGHAWNMVKLDGKWYHVDTTWMDKGSTVDEAYFLADDAQIRGTHKVHTYGDCVFVPVPVANSTAYNPIVSEGEGNE